MQFNDVRLQYERLAAEIDAAIAGVLTGGRYVLGPAVESFEREFSRFCGATSGVGVGSGMAALEIGLVAAGIRRGDEVLVPAVSAAATAMAAARVGARPVFVDIAPDDFTMDPAAAFERRSGRTRAAIPVHLYGMPARLQELETLEIPLLEDAAQAHGSRAGWGRCGSFGAAAAFSFYPTKNLGAYGDGGMLVTSDAALADRARLLRNYGQRDNYSSEILGDNSRLDEVHAAVLRVKLQRLDEWNRRRREIAAGYREALADLPVGLQRETGESNYHLFVLTTPQRDRLQQHLHALGIPTAVHYPAALTAQPAFAEFDPAPCPNAERLCAEALSLPMHAALTDAEADRVVGGVRSFFRSAAFRSASRRNR